MPDKLLRHIPTVKNPFEFIDKIKLSQNSFEVYKKNLLYFAQWLEARGLPDQLPLPATIIRQYLEEETLNKLSHNTIKQRLWAIAWLHTINGYDAENNPVYEPCLRFIHRKCKKVRASLGLSNQPTQKTPLETEAIKRLADLCPDSTRGKRDRALLLLGFATALRRGELAELKVQDVCIAPDLSNVDVVIRQSKTDQLAAGQTLVIHGNATDYCPVKALKTWLNKACLKSGFIFRQVLGKQAVSKKAIGGEAIAKIIKCYCEQAGLDPKLYAGHSLRRGLLISAIKKGRSFNAVRCHARHQNSSTTEHYIGNAFDIDDNPTLGIFE